MGKTLRKPGDVLVALCCEGRCGLSFGEISFSLSYLYLSTFLFLPGFKPQRLSSFSPSHFLLCSHLSSRMKLPSGPIEGRGFGEFGEGALFTQRGWAGSKCWFSGQILCCAVRWGSVLKEKLWISASQQRGQGALRAVSLTWFGYSC